MFIDFLEIPRPNKASEKGIKKEQEGDDVLLQVLQGVRESLS